MRLSNVLSKRPKPTFESVDGFLVGKAGNVVEVPLMSTVNSLAATMKLPGT